MYQWLKKSQTGRHFKHKLMSNKNIVRMFMPQAIPVVGNNQLNVVRADNAFELPVFLF